MANHELYNLALIQSEMTRIAEQAAMVAGRLTAQDDGRWRALIKTWEGISAEARGCANHLVVRK